MTSKIRGRVALLGGLAVIGVAAVVLLAGQSGNTGFSPATLTGQGSGSSFVTPAPATDEPAQAPGSRKTAVLAGGCFWGVQGVFQHVKGVTQAESGYAGGDQSTADYETVGTGTTGHAESVRITYDPSQVTYGQLLQVFFSVVQDPTQLDRQGPDTGTQYRSAIFAQDATQQRVADAYVQQLSQAAVFGDPIVTKVEPNTGFFAAEAYHQNFLDENPMHPYIVVNDKPKVADLQRLFPDLYRDEPVLVPVAN